jgi:hypothetical protein
MQKLKFITHTSHEVKGREGISVEVYSIYDTKHTAPHAIITWHRGKDEDSWGDPIVELVPAAPKPKDAADYAAILRSVTTCFEEVKTAETNPDALLVAIEKAEGVHVTFDARVSRLVPVDSIKEVDGKFWKPAGTSIPIVVKAVDEEAAAPLVSAAFARQASNPFVSRPFMKWVEGGCKVVESETGAAPDVAPITGYLTRSQEKKATERKAAK